MRRFTVGAENLVIVGSGANTCQLVKLSYKNLRSGIRLEPIGLEHRVP